MPKNAANFFVLQRLQLLVRVPLRSLEIAEMLVELCAELSPAPAAGINRGHEAAHGHWAVLIDKPGDGISERHVRNFEKGKRTNQ
jgi:hypothetical protein